MSERPFCLHCMHMLCGEVHIPFENSVLPVCKEVAPDSEAAREFMERESSRIKEAELVF